METEELDQEQVKKDLEKWAKALRKITLFQDKINNLIHKIYIEMNEVYKNV